MLDVRVMGDVERGVLRLYDNHELVATIKPVEQGSQSYLVTIVNEKYTWVFNGIDAAVYAVTGVLRFIYEDDVTLSYAIEDWRVQKGYQLVHDTMTGLDSYDAGRVLDAYERFIGDLQLLKHDDMTLLSVSNDGVNVSITMEHDHDLLDDDGNAYNYTRVTVPLGSPLEDVTVVRRTVDIMSEAEPVITTVTLN